jgi:anthranilate phosphoribosyltransferase
VSSPLRSALARVSSRDDLAEDEAAAAIECMMGGEAPAVEIAGFLAALRTKGETIDEVVGAARAMRARAERVVSARQPLIDTCGTGGDGGVTFSISTAAALVAAGAGAIVAKHGNRAASVRFGGADVLESLGVVVDLPAPDVGRCLDEVGMAFLFAPRLHPAMRHVAPVRRELGVRTIFNLLGPLTNPAGVERQVIGVPSREASPSSPERSRASAACTRWWCTAGTASTRSRSPRRRTRSRCGPGSSASAPSMPRASGLDPAPLAALAASDREHASRMVRDVVAGVSGPAADVVTANAAAALYVAGLAADLLEGARRAREAIATEPRERVLAELVRFTRAAGARTTSLRIDVLGCSRMDAAHRDPPDILARIVAHERSALAGRRATRPPEALRADAAWDLPRRSLAGALRARVPAIIAECKRRSPSRGVLREPYDPVAIGRAYERAGAAAISVLTNASSSVARSTT